MNGKRCGRKLSWHNLRYRCGICVAWLMETTKILSTLPVSGPTFVLGTSVPEAILLWLLRRIEWVCRRRVWCLALVLLAITLKSGVFQTVVCILLVARRRSFGSRRRYLASLLFPQFCFKDVNWITFLKNMLKWKEKHYEAMLHFSVTCN